MMENCHAEWVIASGSLRNRVTFESSLSLFNDDGEELEEQQPSALAADVESTSDSRPLLLRSPSPDSGPCEIRISFMGKHELRQVYVRSTARVYEIYTAPDLQSNNEYLCTVRCGVAARDGEVLCAPSIQEITSSHVEGSNGELCEENTKCEDDWVEVKVPDSAVLDARNIPSQNNSYTNSTNTSQDLFEATAEINDANPCISVTLRLLSLQNKGCAYVEEIYIFADPLDSADAESQESHNENSSGSSLMAMFLPTLMQLSRTSGLGHLNGIKKENQLLSDLDETQPSDSAIKTPLKGKVSVINPQEVKLKEVSGGLVAPSLADTSSEVSKMQSYHTTVPSQSDKMASNHSAVSSQVAPTQSSHGDSLGGNVERSLELLVSRMDRLEQICLTFQEKMLIPMSSIEARLLRVEQQLETLTKKQQDSGPSYCSVFASNASCSESDGIDHTVSRESESDKKSLHTEVQSICPDDISYLANTTHLLPGLVITAPEFPDGEDEEDNTSGQKMNSSINVARRSLDDAVYSALANFVSSMSSESPKYSKSLTVKAPEFLSEDDDDHESNNEIDKNDSVRTMESGKISHSQVLTLSNIPLESEEEVDGDSKDKHIEEIAQEAECGQFCSVEGDQEVHVTSFEAEHTSRTVFRDNFEDDQNRKIIFHQSDDSLSNGSDISNELLDNQLASSSMIAQEGSSASTEVTVASEVPKRASHEDLIENVLGFSLASSVVDFSIPLLDVKFISQRNTVTDPLLEALLVDTHEGNTRDPFANESSDDLTIEKNDEPFLSVT